MIALRNSCKCTTFRYKYRISWVNLQWSFSSVCLSFFLLQMILLKAVWVLIWLGSCNDHYVAACGVVALPNNISIHGNNIHSFFVAAAAIIMAMIIAAICFAFFFVFDFAIVYEFRVHCNSVVKPSSLWIQFSLREKKSHARNASIK